MKVFLTLDYELYFGEKYGTVEQCMLQPTRELMKISKATGACMTFFIDVGFIIRLEEAVKEHPQLQGDLDGIINQITQLVAEGHDCQLHIHPHWEDSFYDGKQWQIKVDRYKLADFSDEEVDRIVREYHGCLSRLTGKKIDSYRAGGWCLQPFSKVRKPFEVLGIRKDSTVFPGGHFESEHYFYDFRNCPDKSRWTFSDDLVKEQNGPFLELPISSKKTGPLFFWELFGWGRINPKDHKPIGDGYPIPTPGARKKMLTKGMLHSVSLDGYFAKQLPKALRQLERSGKEDMVVIGHPKACTWYSLKQLKKFIERHKDQHQFLTFADVE